MFAVVRFKGQQYRVREGDVVALDKFEADVGVSVELDEVLMVGGEAGADVGNPVLEGVRVTAEVISHERGPKVEVFKLKRRKNYKKLRGHRQPYTLVKVLSVTKR